MTILAAGQEATKLRAALNDPAQRRQRPLPAPAGVLVGPADADNYRVKVGRYGDRWYTDPLPACKSVSTTDAVWPSVSIVKKASGSDWSFVALKRVAEILEAHPTRLDAMSYEERYEALKAINKVGLTAAGARGTAVHAMCEALLKGQPIDVAEGDPGAEYRAAVEQFFDVYQPELVAAEFVAIHRELNGAGYGGTGDVIGRIDGRLYVIDWKSRGVDSPHNAYPEDAAQVGAYGNAQYLIVEGDTGPERAPLPTLDGGLVVSIRPDGARIYPVDLDRAFEHWSELHAWWCARRVEREPVGRPWPPRKVAALPPSTDGGGQLAGEEPAASSPAPPPLPDEGDNATSDTQIAVLRRLYGELGVDGQRWVNGVVADAETAGLPVGHAGTERRLSIGHGLVGLAAVDAFRLDDLNEVARALAAAAAKRQPSAETTVGAAVGQLDAGQAFRFHGLTIDYRQGRLAANVNAHGHLTFTQAKGKAP